ncbi:MAG: UDP-glucose 4-epimerase GalE [Chlorobi bacterium]|nr:UDP-glucose 4-epimerase GalE [Chlorobiota bacterium]
MKKKILVTGGTGYIGSHTTVELINSGYEVIIVDDLSNSELSVLDGIEKITGIKPGFVKFDLCDRERLMQFFEDEKNITAIIHFAASKSVGESVQKPLKYYRNNLVSLINLIEGMQQHNVTRMVFSSSCTVYGQPDTLPVSENAPVKPAASPYGNTKQISEEMLQDVLSSDEILHCISLRYFNPIGAHPTGWIGEHPMGKPENLVPYVTQTAIGLRSHLRVFGIDYHTPDGSAIRDYLHVVDLAKAHVAAINRMLEGKQKDNYEVFNLGTGKGYSVLEIIHTFEEATGVKVKYVITDRRPGDVEKVWADTTKANRELGWYAKSSLAEALVSAWKWEQYYRKNYRKP